MISKIASQRILILDGAMGTMIQSYGLSEDDFRGQRYVACQGTLCGNNDMLNLTRPDVIADIHRRYLEAGADIITTNTFCSQTISQKEYHLEADAYAMALEGARIARQMADRYATEERPRWVAGSVGPTNKTCSMSPDVSNPAARNITYDELFDAYLSQGEALIEGGVDLILIETIFDTLNAKAALAAMQEAMRRRQREVPVMLSVTVSDLNGRTLSGQTLSAFLATMSSFKVFSLGLNCSFGARQMKPFLAELAAKAPCFVSAHPNAGLPNAMGEYDETTASMEAQIKEFVDEQLVNIVGGCCGTTDEFIRCYPALVEGKTPRQPQPKCPHLQLAGLEPLEVKEDKMFVNVGERCNVAGSRKFLRLIKEHQYEEALGIARRQVEDGALVIDVNMDDGLLDAEHEMTTFLNMIAAEPDIARVPVMIDSSHWEVVEAGLKCVQGKAIVNSISLKEGEEVFLHHARCAKRFGAAVVVMCFDEEGQATTFERRIAIASRAYRLLIEEVGMCANDIIFDPNVLAVATGIEEHDAYALSFIHATEWIRHYLPGAHVSGGVSNLSFAFRGNNALREAMHAVFLYHAIAKGMDFGIVNPNSSVTYDDIPAHQLKVIEDVILYRHADASERLVAMAEEMKEAAQAGGTNTSADTAQQEASWRSWPVADRIAEAMVKGVADWLETDITEALQCFPHAVDIIEGPLMQGMNTVGERFGSGKMFLPQVVKSARTMKRAVALLQPAIVAQQQGGAAKAGRVLLATVKGDVHDIGKNIVGVVMSCNNYDVIDLGVMVPAHQIVEKAIELKADIIGLSGLITPSLEEMVAVAREMERANLDIPIMIGGATTSEMHVAVKIAPVYSGPVVWMKDASQNALVASRLLNAASADDYVKELNEKYEDMRTEYSNEQQQLSSLADARSNRLKLFSLFFAALLGCISAVAQPKREFRGAWIQCVNGQFLGMTSDEMQHTLAYQLDELQKDGVNAIIFQVRPECDALYPSKIEPWSRFLTGQQGRAPQPYWDPLQFMVDEAHRRGMELHAWINPYRAKTKGTTALSPRHIAITHPERVFAYDGQYIMNPGIAENRSYICNVVGDILRRYDVDGLHIDDYFYPYPAAGVTIPDDREYQLNSNGIADRGDWRRYNVNLFIRQLHDTIKAVKPWVKFGVSPFGIYRNSNVSEIGSNTKGLQNYDDLYADVLLWVNNGWIDYCVPQIYWQVGHPTADYKTLLEWWNRYAAHRPLFIGEDVERTVKHADTQHPQQHQMAEKFGLRGKMNNVQGAVLWYAKAAVDNVGNYGTLLRNKYWAVPALQPRMPFIDDKAPGKVKKLKVIEVAGDKVLFWTAPKGKDWRDNPHRYVVYRFEKGEKQELANPRHIVAITPDPFYKLPSADRATYVVTTLDRLQNESRGVKKKVK